MNAKDRERTGRTRFEFARSEGYFQYFVSRLVVVREAFSILRNGPFVNLLLTMFADIIPVGQEGDVENHVAAEC